MSADPHPTFDPHRESDQPAPRRRGPLSLPLAPPQFTSSPHLTAAHLTPDGDAFIPEGADPPAPAATPSRPAIGVYFECANQYVRVYRDAGGSTYLARCPRCAKTMSFRVAPGGSTQRMFRASCR